MEVVKESHQRVRVDSLYIPLQPSSIPMQNRETYKLLGMRPRSARLSLFLPSCLTSWYGLPSLELTLEADGVGPDSSDVLESSDSTGEAADFDSDSAISTFTMVYRKMVLADRSTRTWK